ncbi:MAG: FAD/NAD(P)-binding protein [Myxococcota bacterium]
MAGPDYDWLIVGGGIHGVHLATRLLGDAEVNPRRLAIVDPNPELLAVWRRCTAATGMTHLRSPAVHNVDVAHSSLFDFVGRRKRKRPNFLPPYNRPSLQYFNAHCDEVLKSYGLAALHVRGFAVDCSLRSDGVDLALSSGRVFSSRRVVLALGASEHLNYPDWVAPSSSRIHHVFDPRFTEWPTSPERIVVVGGGISAAQLGLRMVDSGHQVTILARHPWRRHQFDSDSGWLGPKLMTGFSRERDIDLRRNLIERARHRGSIPPDVDRALKAAAREGRLEMELGAVESVDESGPSLRLRLLDGSERAADRVLLATGFSTGRPGGALVDRLVKSAALSCAHCGYPVIDDTLRWHEHIHVAGPLAELELGPVARNIAGARRAADRILKTLAHQKEKPEDRLRP